tara:strand:- start:3875 stop:4051 length:177 start_codon:yes stop_codon:yes gene_type:complete
MAKYIKEGSKIIKTMYAHYNTMCEILMMDPLPYHAFSAKEYTAVEKDFKQYKLINTTS